MGMRGSGPILMWSVLLLSSLQIFVALVINGVIAQKGYFEDENVPLSDRKQVFMYFGSFSRSLLSCFEITMGNWPPVARLLMDKIGEGFIIFSIVHKLFIGFAV